jgi:rhodanese-related sulfurtransferase
MTTLERLTGREDSCQLPISLGDGRFEVDATWGEVQPMQLAPGVRTVAELEVIEHIKRDQPLIDTRLEEFLDRGTIGGARNIPHERILEHLADLDPGQETVFFCNGPQCTATPDAIRQLLRRGYPPQAILYYRGGIHDWMTLGFPLTNAGS